MATTHRRHRRRLPPDPPRTRHVRVLLQVGAFAALALVAALPQFGGSLRGRADPAPAGVWRIAQPFPKASDVVAPQASPDEIPDREPDTLASQRDGLVQTMTRRLNLSQESVAIIRQIIDESPVLGQGNPKTTTHPMTRSECREIRRKEGLVEKIYPPCGDLNMVPVYDPAASQTPQDARICIDQFEFPNLACEYPVVYVRASEAVRLCSALGKRICDAHEWEGACAGELKSVKQEYWWDRDRIEASFQHNKVREIRWAYGPTKDHSKCATGGRKNPKCFGGEWSACGSNTFPAGAFPRCVSPFGVYDLHGNAAEHMNLPEKADELAALGRYGSTEMKGSWFIFQAYEAHEDDCRWRALAWHDSHLTDDNSHRNYHLGFRCCRDISLPDSG